MRRTSRFRIEVIELDETENETHPFARAFESDDCDTTEIKLLAAVAQRLATSDIVELPRNRAPRSTASGSAPLEIDDEITTILAKP